MTDRISRGSSCPAVVNIIVKVTRIRRLHVTQNETDKPLINAHHRGLTNGLTRTMILSEAYA